jgi:Replication-relaxation
MIPVPTKNFQLMDGDVELLHHVHQLRVATIDHLMALSGRSDKALSRRLLKLTQHRYLACLTRRPQKHCYAVGQEGIPVLIEHGYAPRDLAEKRIRHQELKEIAIKHFLFVVDIHVKLLQLTREGPITLVHWQEGPSLYDQVAARDGEGRDVLIPVRPDSYFILQHAERPEGKNRLHYFLEADRGTMSHARMALKIAGYQNYFQKAIYARKYAGMKFFQVATVTETRARAASLAADLQRIIPAASRRAYPFVAFEDLTLEALLPPAPSAASTV